MKCKEIKELLMADYIDGEVSEVLKKEVQGHLNTCSECRQFEHVLRKTAIEPFKRAGQIQPPDAVWNQIRETIAKGEEQAEGFLVGLRDRLHAIFSARKSVFVVATVMIIILVTIVFTRLPFNSQEGVSGYLEEQAEFLAYLDGDATGFFDKDYIDLGTSIEECFF